MMEALDAGAEDFVPQEDAFEVYTAPSDFSAVREALEEKGVIVTDEDDADQYMIDNVPGTMVSYVAVPSEPVAGSYCYKMLIDAQTHKLYYFKRHRIGKKAGEGFLPEDIDRIKASRR